MTNFPGSGGGGFIQPPSRPDSTDQFPDRQAFPSAQGGPMSQKDNRPQYVVLMPESRRPTRPTLGQSFIRNPLFLMAFLLLLGLGLAAIALRIAGAG